MPVGLMTAMATGVDFGEFGPKQEYLCRVVYPQEHDDQRTRRAVAGCDGAATDIKTDQRLADGEEKCSNQRTDHDVVPFDRLVRKHLVDSAEEWGNEPK